MSALLPAARSSARVPVAVVPRSAKPRRAPLFVSGRRSVITRRINRQLGAARAGGARSCRLSVTRRGQVLPLPPPPPHATAGGRHVTGGRVTTEVTSRRPAIRRAELSIIRVAARRSMAGCGCAPAAAPRIAAATAQCFNPLDQNWAHPFDGNEGVRCVLDGRGPSPAGRSVVISARTPPMSNRSTRLGSDERSVSGERCGRRR